MQSEQSTRPLQTDGQESIQRKRLRELQDARGGGTLPGKLSVESMMSQPKPRRFCSEEEARVMAHELHDREYRKKKLWVSSCAPARHAEKAHQFSSPEEWSEKRDRLCSMQGSGYLVALLGGRGPGKTQASVDAIRSACDGLKTCLYTSAHGLFMDVRAAFSDDSSVSEASVVDKYSSYDLLVIDEMGVRGETEFENRTLIHIIDSRYNGKKDTILIANLTVDSFSESVGSSIMDRLRETGGVMEFSWPSFRGNNE